MAVLGPAENGDCRADWRDGVYGEIQLVYPQQTTSNTMSAAKNSYSGLFKGLPKANCAQQWETAWEADTKGCQPLEGLSSRDLEGRSQQVQGKLFFGAGGLREGQPQPESPQTRILLSPTPGPGTFFREQAEQPQGSCVSSASQGSLSFTVFGPCLENYWVYLLVVCFRQEYKLVSVIPSGIETLVPHPNSFSTNIIEKLLQGLCVFELWKKDRGPPLTPLGPNIGYEFLGRTIDSHAKGWTHSSLFVSYHHSFTSCSLKGTLITSALRKYLTHFYRNYIVSLGAFIKHWWHFPNHLPLLFCNLLCILERDLPSSVINLSVVWI